MELNRWWLGDPAERFWMEITGRADIGADLHAPALADSGYETPSYSLVREVADGDVVLHYEKDVGAITAWSIAQGGHWQAEMTWGTPRSTGPSGAPVDPYLRPGLWRGLHGPFLLDAPLTLAELRQAEEQIEAVFDTVQFAHQGALYLPFQLREDGLRAAQGYLFKMPAEVVEAFAMLAPALTARGAEPPPVPGAEPTSELGLEYEPADEEAAQAERDPFPLDPAVAERGIRSHARLQNLLAAHVATEGLIPKRPGPGNPPWDLLWTDEETVWVAEVKSLTPSNEERQLRLGLGQLLRYRHRLDLSGVEARAVLMTEREPTDSDWQDLCSSLNVLLVWPEVLAEAI